MTNRPMRYVALMLLTWGLTNALQGQELIKRALDQTIDEAAQEAAQKLKATQFTDVNNIAVLPFWGDCSDEIRQYVTRTIQDQIIGGRYRVMERSDAAWNSLLGEIAILRVFLKFSSAFSIRLPISGRCSRIVLVVRFKSS